MKIELTKSEVRIINWLANQRQSIARKRGIADQKVGGQDSLQIDIDGMTGEFAFAKMFNLWPDLQVGHRPVHDIESKLGGIDVKTTRYRTGRLLATKKKNEHPSDWYALMWLEDERTVHFLGAASSMRLLDDANLKDLGRGAGYALDQSELMTPEAFKRMLDGDCL